MPRQSYREHRAQRARTVSAYGSDAELESVASYSTLASHTTLGSIYLPRGASISTGSSLRASTPGPPTLSDRSSSVAGLPSSSSLAPAWTPAGGATPLRPRTWSTPASSVIGVAVGVPDSPGGASASGSGVGTVAHPGHRRRRASGSIGGSPAPSARTAASASGLSPSPRLSASRDAPTLGVGLAPGSAFRSSSTSGVGDRGRGHARRESGGASSGGLRQRPTLHHLHSGLSVQSGLSASDSTTNLNNHGNHNSATTTPAAAPTTTALSDKEKEREERHARRRTRAKNEERWRRVRAREAAHDAPLRRAAKASQSKWGHKGAYAAVLAAAALVRVVLTALALYFSSDVRNTLAAQVIVARSACVNRPKLWAPVCNAVYSGPSTGLIPALALLGGHLVLEAVLGWGAALAWAVVEGYREGRTTRTKVAAVVYLCLAPVMALSDGALLQMRTVPLGLVAWALLAACSGRDTFAAAAIAAAVWSNKWAAVYLPGFGVYAVGKRIWLGRERGRGYISHLVVAATSALVGLEALQPVPLRERVSSAVGVVKQCTNPSTVGVCLKPALSLVSLSSIVTLVAWAPSVYLVLRASYNLRPNPTEPATARSVPATTRLLPLALTATAAAVSFWRADAALPLLPLALMTSLRGDDDEWAVAVQAHQVAAAALWPALGNMGPALLALATAYQLFWGWLVGARWDAPHPAIRAHQEVTRVGIPVVFAVSLAAALVPHGWWPSAAVDAAVKVVPWASAGLRAFVMASVAMLVVWGNVRLVKSAWAIGAL